MKRKIFCFLLATALILTLLPVTALAAYTDVDGHWAQAAIEKWSGRGILQGYGGSFRPEDPISRGEMAVILDRIMNYQTAAQNRFSDLGQADYTQAILNACAAGVIIGYRDMVRPADSATREEAAVMLGRALGIQESEKPAPFEDHASISSWAKGMVGALAARGILQSTDGAFHPKSPVTRGEAAVMLDRAVSALCDGAAEYSGDYIGTVIVNTAGAVLRDMTVTGDLIIAQGAANGDVTLSNVTVTGNTIIRGGGAESIVLKGASRIDNMILEKTDEGRLRIAAGDGSVVNILSVVDGRDDIILTGAFGHVIIDAGVTVYADGASVDILDITNSQAWFVINMESVVGTLNVGADGARVDNNGTVETAVFNAENIVFSGNQP